MQVFNTASFLSIWYWALTILVWTLVTRRALGVPHDMLLRAARLPEVGSRVDLLAHVTAERVNGVARMAGAPLAGLAGFCLAVLSVLGLLFGAELARAVLPLALPLCLIATLDARLAARIRAENMRGEALRLSLTRHRAANQGIAILAMFAAAMLAVTGPGYFVR